MPFPSCSAEKRSPNVYKVASNNFRNKEEFISHAEQKRISPLIQRLSEHAVKLEKAPEKRGPKTPPGSPGAHQERSASYCSSARTVSSSSSPPPPPPFLETAAAAPIIMEENDIYNYIRQGDDLMHKPSCTPLPPPPALPDFDTIAHRQGGNYYLLLNINIYNTLDKLNNQITREINQKKQLEDDNNQNSVAPVQELLRHFSNVTNTPVSQLAEYIGEDLQNAMNRLDRKVLLSTLKNALQNVTADTTPPPPVPHNNNNGNNVSSQQSFSNREGAIKIKADNGIEYSTKRNAPPTSNNIAEKQRYIITFN